jgi:hypothetical protein
VSAYLYGRLTRTVEQSDALKRAAVTAAETPEQKMAAIAQKLAALVPADILIIHAAILAGATELAEEGSTTVTRPDVLKWSLPILAGSAVVLFLIGRLPNWEDADYVRMLIPAAAFATWTLLTGTSAATPWFENTDHLWLILVGGVLGLIILAVADRVIPKAGS